MNPPSNTIDLFGVANPYRLADFFGFGKIELSLDEASWVVVRVQEERECDPERRPPCYTVRIPIWKLVVTIRAYYLPNDGGNTISIGARRVETQEDEISQSNITIQEVMRNNWESGISLKQRFETSSWEVHPGDDKPGNLITIEKVVPKLYEWIKTLYSHIVATIEPIWDL